MKIRHFLALLAATLIGSPAWADVGILVEYIELEERAATKLLLEHAGKAEATALRGELQRRVEGGEAKIVSTSFVRTMPQQRVKLESIHEFIYPTEFDPPEIPQDLSGPIAPGTDITTPASPTAYEMRPAGDTLEADPTQGEDGIIELNLALERVEFVDYLGYGKDEAEVKQPLFYTTKITTALRVRDGGYALVGVQTPRKKGGEGIAGDEARRILVLLRASALDAAAEDEREAAEGSEKPEPKPE